MKKNIVQAVGVLAFVIGGLIARQKAMEGVEILDKTFKKTPEDPSPAK